MAVDSFGSEPQGIPISPEFQAATPGPTFATNQIIPELPPDSAPEQEIITLFQNFADKPEVVEKVKKSLQRAFNLVSNRDSLEAIWKKNDEMYRVKPNSSSTSTHRANESTGVFNVSINQLVSIAYKTFTDNPDAYYYEPFDYADPNLLDAIKKNCRILTKLLRKSMSRKKFKQNLKKILFEIYKHGTAFAGIPWDEENKTVVMIDKNNGSVVKHTIHGCDLPYLQHEPIDCIWLDQNLDNIEDQEAIFIRSPITWNKLIIANNSNKIKLPARDDEKFIESVQKYKESSGSQYLSAKNDEITNADRDNQEFQNDYYKHWYVWIKLPLNPETGEWDENQEWPLYRVRTLGDPTSCEVLEIRQNIFPDGVPMLVAHQTSDDIGMYPISLGEKVETHFDQLCTAVNQLIDNRSKNTRRPFFYDPLRVSVDKYDFGHSETIPVDGDPSTAVLEMQLADMTGTIMNSVVYNEEKIKEIMNTTAAVMGVAMMGRTSASEYQGARTAATTPIFADLGMIEEDLIIGYMKKFLIYVHNFMTPDDIVKAIGPEGMEFQFDVMEFYEPKAHGVTEYRDKIALTQNLLQLYQMIVDEQKKGEILVRLARVMGIENPEEILPRQSADQATKAALWENNEMLVYGQMDAPEQGELHSIHLPIHKQGYWKSKMEKNPNSVILADHIKQTEVLQSQEQQASSFMQPLSPDGQPGTAGMAMTPGQISGEQIAAQMGQQQGGMNTAITE